MQSCERSLACLLKNKHNEHLAKAAISALRKYLVPLMIKAPSSSEAIQILMIAITGEED